MKTVKMTLTNEFHGTSVTLSAKIHYGLALLTLSPWQVRKAKSTLCGIEGCSCSNELGQRPAGDWDVTPNCGATYNGDFDPHYANIK